MLHENRREHEQTGLTVLRETFKPGFIHLAPVLASLVFGVLCAYLRLTTTTDFYQITPFQEGVGSLGNALYFVILVAVGATILYVLLKRNSRRLIMLLTGFAITSAVFMLSILYLAAIFSVVTVPYADVVVLILSILIAIFVDVAIFRLHNKIGNVAVLLLGGALGAFLGVSIPTLSAIAILSLLAVYDVFAVYHGPVGKIASRGLEQLRGLSFSFREVQMGLGDLTFYSMLTSRVLASAGLVFSLGSVAGVLVGVFLAFKMLERKGIFPGLPFPIILGLIPLIVSLFV
jgi:presenilin-like A22 family membrane protease